MKRVPGIERFYLAGGCAVAHHLHHRASADLDLAVMKLAAIGRRGLKRDFWDLYELVRSGLDIESVTRAYLRRFGKTEADLYHVLRALTWFEEAERQPIAPEGLTAVRWKAIRKFFEEQAPKLIAQWG